MLKKSLFFILFFGFITSFFSNTLLAAENDSFFSPENQKLQQNIADKAIACSKAFVTRFNQKSGSAIVIKDTFYDSKFHRIYFEVDGKLTVSKSIHNLFVKGEKIYSSDGEIAFDFVLKNPAAQGNKIAYEIEGELIIFQKNILLNIARMAPGANLVFNPVGETVLKILDEGRFRQLADIAAETLTSFSPDNLDKLKEELQKRADAMGDTNLQKVLFLTRKTGHFTRFFVLCLIKSVPGIIGESVGGSIGSVIGSLLLPGAGTLVGAYIGSVISGQIVYTSQYRIPINLRLARMKTLGKLCNNGENDNVAGRKFNALRKKFNQDIRQDLDKHSYIVVDEVLKALKEMKKDNDKLFKVVAGDLQEILQYQLVHENDRYAARKLKQLGNL